MTERPLLWSAVAVYVGYALIFFTTHEGQGGYFWVNNDFFWPAFLAVLVGLSTLSLWRHIRVERSLAEVVATGILTVGFVPFTYLLTLVLYSTTS